MGDNMGLKKSILVLLMVSFVVCITFFLSKKTSYVYEISGRTMGTMYSIKIPTSYDGYKVSSVSKDVEVLLENINQIFSTFRRSSQISALNMHQSTEPYEVSTDLFSLFVKARDISEKTNGSFDITVGPLVNYWGFGSQTKKINKMPSKGEVEPILKRVGSDKYVLDAQNHTVTKKDKEVYFDFAAMAKGFGVDEVAKLFLDNGINDFMVEIGGEVVVRGYKNPSKKTLWKIAINNPSFQQKSKNKVLDISGVAMATSGDYQNFFTYNSKKYSHEISPKTGYPVEHNLASVTVFDENCAKADAFATALMVMGEKNGFDWAVENQIPAIFYVRDEKKDVLELKTPFVEVFFNTKSTF
jgi:thiamine biosynthesis lipoprotein